MFLSLGYCPDNTKPEYMGLLSPLSNIAMTWSSFFHIACTAGRHTNVVSVLGGCSQYSLTFSRKEPHAASDEAKVKVEQLQAELASASVRKGIATCNYLAQWKGVPVRSKAMLVCKVWVKEEVASYYFPRRPPIIKDSDKVISAPTACCTMPAFLIHFS